MFRITAAEGVFPANASAQAASTASNPSGKDRDENVDHLAVTIIDTARFFAHPIYQRR